MGARVTDKVYMPKTAAEMEKLTAKMAKEDKARNTKPAKKGADRKKK